MKPIRTQGRLSSPNGAPAAANAGYALAVALLLATVPAQAFDSGSTGADGALAPSVSTELALPEDGVFNFTSVDIPEGVTLSFAKNSTNTPVVLLVSGDVSIAGSILLSATNSADVGAAGDGAVGDDGLPGEGGPGGYDGGRGGPPQGDYLGGSGHGPGAGGQGVLSSGYRGHGGGGSFGTPAGSGHFGSNYYGVPGDVYGSSLLLPLIGGSGGGGGMGGGAFAGSGGGGGGGALLIAATGTIDVTGAIRADGGYAGDSIGANCGALGGGGSGGGIRLVATSITGNGTISAAGGGSRNAACTNTSGYYVPRYTTIRGGAGRIRLEADTLLRTAATDPAYSFGPPGDLYVVGLPGLRIVRVGGVDAPTNPTGVADVQLPADTPNPVTVEFESTGVPLGNIVELTLTPARGTPTTTVSNALDGDSALATASALIDLPQGPSTLLASITYTLVAGQVADLSRFAGEPVKAIRVQAALGGPSRYLLITESGREVPIPRARLAAAG